jgi:hypothetical protein
MADVADVLGLTGASSASKKPSKRETAPERPQGLAREVYALVDHASLPSMVSGRNSLPKRVGQRANAGSFGGSVHCCRGEAGQGQASDEMVRLLEVASRQRPTGVSCAGRGGRSTLPLGRTQCS